MVTTKIVSQYQEQGRKIPNGPLYPTDDVLALLNSESIRAWTKKCITDMEKWAIDSDDLCELTKIALHSGRFLGAEWCVQEPNGPWAACDAYQLIRKEWIPHAHREMDIEYYIKFAINKTGKVLLIVSCHPPEQKGR